MTAGGPPGPLEPPGLDERALRYVKPFYLRILHGNVLYDPEPVLAQLRAVASEVTLDVAADLWSRLGWRERQMASFWATVHGWPETPSYVRPLLLPSEQTYAGEAHCLALARVASEDAAAVLRDYLDTYLPRPDLAYDQPWALAALRVVDEKTARSDAAAYDEAWASWAAVRGDRLRGTEVAVRGLLALAAAVAG